MRILSTIRGVDNNMSGHVYKPKQPVTETFDQPYKSQWENNEFGDVDVLAKLPDGTNLSIMFNNEGDDEWQVEFHRNHSREITGEGDAHRIFATVIKAIQQFVKQYKPKLVRFSASTTVEPGQNSESRAKLYGRIVDRYASAMGYEAYQEDHGDQVTYELTRVDTDLAHINNTATVESRSHADSNPKQSTSDLLKEYLNKYGEGKAYVHFSMLEKVGINPRSRNMYGPHGVYGYPLENAFEVLKQPTLSRMARYANVLVPSSSARILDLDTVSVQRMMALLESAIAFHRKKTKGKPEEYAKYSNVSDTRAAYKGIAMLLSNYCQRRNRSLSVTLNAFFRSHGYDAIRDTSSIMNDNPNQIVFLVPTAYTVVDRIPLRLDSAMKNDIDENTADGLISGKEMLNIFKRMHHEHGFNKQMEHWIAKQTWSLDTIEPEQLQDMYTDDEDDDPFDRTIWLDDAAVTKYERILSAGHLVNPIIMGPRRAVIDGNHRAQAAKNLHVSIPGYVPVKNDVSENTSQLSYFGNCTDDDVIEHLFGDATGFAQAVDEYGDEFTIDDLVVKYDPETDIHSFYYKNNTVTENFADGKGPGRPGDSKRHGIPKHATLAQLDKIAHKGGRKGQLAHWQANMRRGRAKTNESDNTADSYMPLGMAELKELLAIVRNEQDIVDDRSMFNAASSNAEQQYRALTAIEHVIKNNIKALKTPELQPGSIFVYDWEYDDAIGAVQLRVNGTVAELKWLGSYNSSGKKLMQQGLAHAKSMGAKTVNLTSKWGSAEYYKKQGFTPVDNVKDNPITDVGASFTKNITEGVKKTSLSFPDGDIYIGETHITDRKAKHGIGLRTIAYMLAHAARYHGDEIARLGQEAFVIQKNDGTGIAVAKVLQPDDVTYKYIVATIHPQLRIGRNQTVIRLGRNEHTRKITNEAIAPHGDSWNELNLMKLGEKPIALVGPHEFENLYKPVMRKYNWIWTQLSGIQRYIVGQEGQQANIFRMRDLLIQMNRNLKNGIKPDADYHIEMGRLLGYSDADIAEFLKKINL